MKRTLYSLLLTLILAISGLQTAQAGRMYDPEVSRFLSIDPILKETSPLELQKMHGGKFYSNSPYAYVFNNPVKYVDPDGKNPLLVAWAIFEVGMAIYDAYDVVTTLSDPNATNWEIAMSVGGAALGALLPGGGYSAADDVVEGGIKAGKALNKVDDIVEVASDVAKNTKKMSLDDIGNFLGAGKDWHKGSAKKDFLKQFKKELKGDTNADFYVDEKTKEVFLKSNKSGNWIKTGQNLE